MLENSDIKFEMFEVKTGNPVILNANCYLTTRNKKYNQTTDEYYITYRFTSQQTDIIGKYEGVITVQFLDTNSNPTNKLILPIREKLYINII
jgi:hypothetical protein